MRACPPEEEGRGGKRLFPREKRRNGVVENGYLRGKI